MTSSICGALRLNIGISGAGEESGGGQMFSRPHLAQRAVSYRRRRSASMQWGRTICSPGDWYSAAHQAASWMVVRRTPRSPTRDPYLSDSYEQMPRITVDFANDSHWFRPPPPLLPLRCPSLSPIALFRPMKTSHPTGGGSLAKS